MAEYHIGDGHWKGDPIGNIRVLSEPADNESYLRYLIQDDKGKWGWWGDKNPEGKSNTNTGFETFEAARGFGDDRMFVVAVDEPGPFKPGDRVRYTRRGGTAEGWIGTVNQSQRYNTAFQVEVTWDNGEAAYTTPLVSNLERYTEPVSVRAQVLRKAEEIISKDRNSSYGEPEDNFARIAEFWNVFLQDKLAINLTSGDTAVLMILVKLAREINAPSLDNKIDIAGYAACLAQVQHPEGI